MASLTHPTPGDLGKDEEKFFKIFSKKALACCLAASIPGFVLFEFFSILGFTLVGILLWAVLVIIVFVATSYVLPVSGYRYKGGGQALYVIWLRKIYRRMNSCVYIKHYDVIKERNAGNEVF